MAPHEKLRNRISELISRPNSVEFEEVEWVLNQLSATVRRTKHTVMFKIPGCDKPLMLNEHNNGKKALPSYCIRDFRDRMIELGHYELEEDHENS